MTKFEMTKKEMFAEFVALAQANGRNDLVEMANHEIELLNKKANRSNSKKNDANIELANTIFEVMCNTNFKGTCSELIKADARLDMSTPKMSAMLKMLVNDGRVVREVEGKKAIFSVA